MPRRLLLPVLLCAVARADLVTVEQFGMVVRVVLLFKARAL